MVEAGARQTRDSLAPTARERDVLRLLSDGLTAKEVAADLGIAQATLKAHLATIRAKLGARSTAHALVLSERRGWLRRTEDDAATLDALTDRSASLVDLATALRDAGSFSQAWQAMHHHLKDHGVVSLNFALVAEPFGGYRNGAHLVAMSLPDEVRTLYAAAGGAQSDPFIKAMAFGMRVLHGDPARTSAPPGVESIPTSFSRFRDGLCDHRIGLTTAQCRRDPATGAPFGVSWNIARDDVGDIGGYEDAHLGLNGDVGALFWHFVQKRRWLRDVMPLTPRQREALCHAARGFGTAESAEHMGISQRALEKLLHHARTALGAPTTAAAIYRASVFRALG